MRNIRLALEYDGTNYSGWQIQSELPTVQGTVTEALEKLTGTEVKLYGSSRTDAGVHAFGYVANFLTDSTIPVEGIRRGLNSMLPEDIVVKAATEAEPGFDARRHAKSKTYLYKVLNRGFRSALMQRYSWFVFKKLDIERMREAAARMTGERDFTSFHAVDSDAKHSVREVTSIRITEKGDGLIEFEVKGRSFLRHMVRIMVGTLVTVGTGRLTPDDVEDIIEARDRCAAPMTAPPQGLFLMEVEY